MNDNELDDLLNAWDAPKAPASLRERAIHSFRSRFRRDADVPVWRRWAAGLAPRAGLIAALGVFALVLTKAAPLVLWAPAAAASAPFIVETENSEYAEDGSPNVKLYSAAYDNDGREIALSRSVPNDLMETMGVRSGELLGILHAFLLEHVHGIHPGQLENISALRRSGCAIEPAVAHETILNYSTVAVQSTSDYGRRRTIWRAPDLGCLELKYTSESQRADGSFRLVKRSEAVKVIVNKAKGA